MSGEPAGAPGELELVRAFVNTLDVEERRDALASPAALARWLSGHGLLDPEIGVRSADLSEVRAVREALRSLLIANNGGPFDPEAAAVLDRAAARARVTLRFTPAGAASLEPESAGVQEAVGRLLGVVAASMAAGTWSRLKACRADGCHWAFYDHARNRSRTWCSMAVCGNRAKARAHRARRRA